MKQLKTPLFIFLALILSVLSYGQVVNIEKARHQTDTTGISGGLELKGSFLDNEKVIYTFNIVSAIQYKLKKDIFILLGDFKITKSEEVAFQNAAFLHFRYGHEFSDIFRWEAFTQVQNNKVSKLKLRTLVGTGPRLKIINKNILRVYLGIAPMYEYEQIDDAAESTIESLRLSNYLSFTLLFSENAKLITTSYYQPNMGALRDYRFYSESNLSVKLFKKLDLVTSLNYSWDQEPPVDAPKRSLQIKTGFAISF